MAQVILGIAMKRILAPLFLLLATFWFAGGASAQVEYVRFCSAFGAEFFYSPGTETCINANTGETRRVTENGVEFGTTAVVEGVAVSLALPTAFIQEGDRAAIAGSYGMFGGASAFGFAAALQLTDGLSLNAAVGMGLGQQVVGSSVGFNLSW